MDFATSVASLMGISLESIEEFVVVNTEIPPGALGEKLCRLDINMTVDGQCVALEVQASDERDFPERTLYYWAEDYSSTLKSGKDYLELKRTLILAIIDFPLFACKEYRSRFLPLEADRHELLSDKMELCYFELPKAPDGLSLDNRLGLWLSLFKAKTREELERIRALEDPIMTKAVEAYESTTISDEFRELERLRKRARHNEAAALRNARDEGRAEGRAEVRAKAARNMRALDISVDKIAEATGLSIEEIKAL